MRTLRLSTRASLLVIAAMAAGVTLVGCKKGGALEGAAGAGFSAGPPEVGVVTIKAERMPITVELPGRISASLVAEVRPQVTGIILKRLFEEGADVKEGDVLYQIDPALYEAALSSAKAALAHTEANLASLRSQMARLEELIKIHAISQQQYDDTDAALKQAEAELAANKAAIETAKINLGYTQIKAPISGRIGKSSVTVGALVTANQGAALATVQLLNPVYADAPQTSANLLRLRQSITAGHMTSDGAGTPAHLVLEDGSTYSEQGTLQFSDVTVDPTTGSVDLRSSFPNPDGVLLPGMYVRVTVEEGISDRAILVPQRGVTFNPRGEPVAMVVNAENKAEERVLDIGRSINNSWLVLEGLQDGDRVIVEGTLRVRPGAPVSPVPAYSTNNVATVEASADAATL
ncbi:MAG: efflux RND transporter periplasmic adaptor subunit [Kiritimatiellae bacterium]|nr:efflux RND transporter periplasmic adaptor subunit [Kiritimatiellia bacterium]